MQTEEAFSVPMRARVSEEPLCVVQLLPTVVCRAVHVQLQRAVGAEGARHRLLGIEPEFPGAAPGVGHAAALWRRARGGRALPPAAWAEAARPAATAAPLLELAVVLAGNVCGDVFHNDNRRAILASALLASRWRLDSECGFDACRGGSGTRTWRRCGHSLPDLENIQANHQSRRVRKASLVREVVQASPGQALVRMLRAKERVRERRVRLLRLNGRPCLPLVEALRRDSRAWRDEGEDNARHHAVCRNQCRRERPVDTERDVARLEHRVPEVAVAERPDHGVARVDGVGVLQDHAGDDSVDDARRVPQLAPRAVLRAGLERESRLGRWQAFRKASRGFFFVVFFSVRQTIILLLVVVVVIGLFP